MRAPCGQTLSRPPKDMPSVFQLSPFRVKAAFRVYLQVDSRKQSPIWGLGCPTGTPDRLRLPPWEVDKGTAGEGGRASRLLSGRSRHSATQQGSDEDAAPSAEHGTVAKTPPSTLTIKTKHSGFHNLGICLQPVLRTSLQILMSLFCVLFLPQLTLSLSSPRTRGFWSPQILRPSPPIYCRP